MGIEAVIFDIGGVLKVTPPTGWRDRWVARLGVGREEWERRLAPIFHMGSVGAMTLSEVERSIAASLRLEEADLRSLMDDLWS